VTRPLVLAFAGMVLLLVGAAPAPAKDGVVAKVERPIARDAEPGARVTVVWRLTSVESGRARAFAAEGVFMRLFGPDGSRSGRVYAAQVQPGRYRATARVPRGGVERVVIGLMGWNDRGPAPVTFPVIGRVFR
jgi:hypothetical protein